MWFHINKTHAYGKEGRIQYTKQETTNSVQKIKMLNYQISMKKFNKSWQISLSHNIISTNKIMLAWTLAAVACSRGKFFGCHHEKITYIQTSTERVTPPYAVAHPYKSLENSALKNQVVCLTTIAQIKPYMETKDYWFSFHGI